MLASRFARFTSSKRSRVVSSWTNAWITRIPPMFSARSPTTAPILARVSRKATRARRLNNTVATTISGSTLNVSSASLGSIATMAPMIPTSRTPSPMTPISPCERSSLITDTSLITREIVTPTMCLSW